MLPLPLQFLLNLNAGTIYYQKSWTALSLLMMTGSLVDLTQVPIK
jgi:hypothetical protein